MGDNTLEEKTRSYWEVSKAYNSSDKSMTCEQAIKKLGDVEDNTSSKKKVSKKATALLDDIIGYSPVDEVDNTVPDFAA